MGTTRKTKRATGRPTSLTPGVQRVIVRHVKSGSYVETAAAAAGVCKDTLYEWLKRGAKEPRSVYGEFSDAVQRAQAQAEVDAVRTIDQAGKDPKHWQARAWRLERTNPKKFSVRVKMALREQEEAFIERLRDGLPPEVFEHVLRVLTNAAARSPGAGTD